jgi:hypothetical protein
MVPMRIYRHNEHMAEIEVYGLGAVAVNLVDRELCPVHPHGSMRLLQGVWDSSDATVKLMSAIEALADETFPMLQQMPWIWSVTCGQVHDEDN